MKALTFLARRFVAGDQINDAIEAVRRLNADGLKATLDNLGEDSHDRVHALAAAEENLLMLRRLGESGVDANISLKLSQLGMGFDVIIVEIIGQDTVGAVCIAKKLRQDLRLR